MRRVTLEVRNLEKIATGSFFEKVAEMEVIHYLRSDAGGLAGIWRIVLTDPNASPRTLLRSSRGPWWSRFSRIDVLSKGPDGYVAYVEIVPKELASHGRPLDIHIVSMELRNGRMKIMVLGETKELRKLLQQMTEDGIDYKVTEVSDAKFEPNSLLSVLTPQQRRIMVAAFESGYYDVPRRVDSEHLAGMLNLDKSTVVEHLRKAENRLLSQLITKPGV